MNKTLFKDLNPGSKIYVVEVSKETTTLHEGIISKVTIDDESKIVSYMNDVCPFSIPLTSLFKSSVTLIKNIPVKIFTTYEEADEYYTKFEKEQLSSDSDESDNASIEDFIKFFYEMKKFVESLTEDRCSEKCTENRTASCKKAEAAKVEKPKYEVPSQKEIDEKVNPTKPNMNSNGGLKSRHAVLEIVITPEGIEKLHPEHFKGENPLFMGPKIYFQNVDVPEFDEWDDNAIDATYSTIETWILEKYPEFGQLEYEDDWYYNILRTTDYEVDTNAIDFNIFA